MGIVSSVQSLGAPQYHTGLWLKHNKFWQCCQRRDESDAGCQRGEKRHHPGYYTKYGIGDGKWSCCSKWSMSADGCQTGAHPGEGKNYEDFKSAPTTKSLEVNVFGRKFNF